MSFSISFNKEEALDALKQQPTGMLTVSKTIDKSLKPMKKSSSALDISSNNRLLLSGGYKSSKIDQSSRNLSKYFKPKVIINPKEIDWMSYAKVNNKIYF